MNKLYITTAIISLIVLFTNLSCKDTVTHKKEQTIEVNHDASEHDTVEHHEDEEEVHLEKRQVTSLEMKIDSLSKRQLASHIDVSGFLAVPPQHKATVTPVIGANITSILVEEGENVKKGQVLAYISHPDLIEKQTRYIETKNKSILAEKNYLRQKKLYEAGVASGASFQEAEALYLTSKNNVKGKEASLKMLHINPENIYEGNLYQKIPVTSPIKGSIQKVSIKTGQFADAQTQLFEIVNTERVHADFMVFERDVHLLKKGQKIHFNIQSNKDEELVARIISIGKTFEENPKAVHIHAEIVDKKSLLIPGMYLKGKIAIETDKPAQYVLPEEAIVKNGEKYFVFQAESEKDDWHFSPVEIIPGEKDGIWVAIRFMEKLPENQLFAYNKAYYLLAEMQKGETEHSH